MSGRRKQQQDAGNAQKDVRVGFEFESEAYKYKLEELIGDGGYGKVFEADATQKCAAAAREPARRIAMKVEERSSASNIEALVLEVAKDKNCKHIPKILDHGTVRSGAYSFIAMELKGRDLYQLRKERKDAKFSLGTAVRAAIATLEAIKELHETCGYISRDVKPGNFVTGPTTSEDIKNIYLIDFGLCRKYRDANNNVLPSRGEIGWRGTNRYGSIAAHQRQDLARKDDVESWFYMVIELTKGSLPWSTEREREEIYKRKQAALKNQEDFLKDCPRDYKELLRTVRALAFADAPAYKTMIKLLEKILADRGVDKSGPLDWEIDEGADKGESGDTADSFPTSTTQKNKV